MSSNVNASQNNLESYQSALVPEELPYDFQQSQQQEDAPPPKIVSAATKLGLSLIAAALLVGLSGNLLLRATPWGANFSLWIGLIVLAISLLIWTYKPGLLGSGKWLAFPAIFFGASFVWRDSNTLNGLSLLALVLVAGLAAMRAREEKLVNSTVFEFGKTIFLGSFMLALGPALLLGNDTKWQELPREGWAKKAFAFGRGLAIAAPLILIFGGLFVAADAMFSNIVARTFNIDGGKIASHLFLSGFFAWFSAGFLRFLFIKSEQPVQALSRPAFLSLGIIETATVLSLLDLLFASFVAVQFRYFFGGRANILSGRGVEYAEYARHGFFELVWVSVLVLPLLLGVHWLLRKDNPRNEKIFRVLAGIKLLLLFIIMISAMQRMRMYQIECGLTELRVYTMAFMGWLAVVFVWFAATVLRGQRERFAFGALLTGLTMIAALHFANPDALIARVNLQRAIEGKNFDANYTGTISADALPEIMQAMPQLKPEDRTVMKSSLNYRWGTYQFGDRWSWNWARENAQANLKAQQFFAN